MELNVTFRNVTVENVALIMDHSVESSFVHNENSDSRNTNTLETESKYSALPSESCVKDSKSSHDLIGETMDPVDDDK